MKNQKVPRTVFYLACGATLLSGSAAYAQDAMSRLSAHTDTSFANATNRWQLSATNLSQQTDLVSSVLRAQRNAYWLPALSSIHDMESTPGGSIGSGDGLSVGRSAEVSKAANAIWIVATFSKHQVFATDSSGLLLYTEINLTPQQIIRQPEDSALKPGLDVQVDLPGGRAITANGSLVTLDVHPQRYSLQPGHTYLLQLHYNTAGAFYSVDKHWDIVSGTVVPDQPEEIRRASAKTSQLSGRPLADAVTYLERTLPAASGR